ncbi:hyccin 2-like isoform X3 [Antennarius striatus]|uniref:hyccin 2-like isoform X3 n=1 Tax=Antennarius striatus TaxID=241820 RepID=UPI0035ADF919
MFFGFSHLICARRSESLGLVFSVLATSLYCLMLYELTCLTQHSCVSVYVCVCLCVSLLRLCVCGFPRQQQKLWREPCNRVLLDPEFMVQMLTAVYHAIYNGEWEMGREALEDILYRAQLELYSQPLLLGNAMRNSLPDSAPNEPLGRKVLQVEVTPTISRISISAITTASIRRHRWKREDCFDYSTDAELSLFVNPPSLAQNHRHTHRDPAANEERGEHPQSRRRSSSTSVIPPITFEEADGMSGGEDSFNLNDPDEGFSSGASNSSQPSGTKASGGGVGPRGGSLNSSNIKKAITARLSREKEKERERESEALAIQQAEARRHHQRQQSPPASINLDAIQLSPIKKHLSFPAGPTLVRTGSTSSSKSFDCMNFNLNGGDEEREEAAGGSDREGGLPAGGPHRHSTISLKEEHLVRPEEGQDILSPGTPLSKQSRSPSFNMQIISQV